MSLQVQYSSPRIDDMTLAGKTGCGKSYLLLQAVQYSIQKDWISLYIPRGEQHCSASLQLCHH